MAVHYSHPIAAAPARQLAQGEGGLAALVLKAYGHFVPPSRPHPCYSHRHCPHRPVQAAADPPRSPLEYSFQLYALQPFRNRSYNQDLAAEPPDSSASTGSTKRPLKRRVNQSLGAAATRSYAPATGEGHDDYGIV